MTHNDRIRGVRAAAAGMALICGAAGMVRGAPPTDDAPFYANTFEKVPAYSAMTELGRALFLDPVLSASGKVACATCHDPKRAFGPPNDSPVQRAGSDGRHPGVRAVPSLTYAQNVPPFTEHYVEDEGDDSIDQGPAGGRNWDGRARSAHDQARLPLFSPFEMANPGVDAVVARIEESNYAAQFRDTFGDHVFDDKTAAFKAVLLVLEAFQQSPAEFYPYNSKYDAWLRHQTSLSAAELRGLAAFNDPAKGNCARCHPSGMRNGAFPQFTDFGFAAVGAPRNRAIPANAERGYYDLGLCGPLRTDLASEKQYCGLFRTPSLRNAAVRRVYFHNGVFHRLEDVVRFYAERDTSPEKWYSQGTKVPMVKFDDLPADYRGNVDIQAPFDRHQGDMPALNDGDIADIAAFLRTLTDGYELPSGRSLRKVVHAAADNTSTLATITGVAPISSP